MKKSKATLHQEHSNRLAALKNTALAEQTPYVAQARRLNTRTKRYVLAAAEFDAAIANLQKASIRVTDAKLELAQISAELDSGQSNLFDDVAEKN